MHHSWIVVVCGVLIALGTAQSFAQDAAVQKTPIIILKLDDVNHWVSPRWEKVTAFLQERKIRASYGIITSSLEKAKQPTIDWIKKLHTEGQIEFWHHGYTMRGPKDQGEFEHGTAEEQAALLKKGEDLAKEKLGFPLVAFGPHWTGTTEETEKAIEATPEIKIWLYGPKEPKHFTRLSIPRIQGLENPTFVPDFDKFKDTYDKYGFKQPVLVLQGHPEAWGADERWNGFVKIIDFLQAHGCTFMTPSEYLAHTQTQKSAAQ